MQGQNQFLTNRFSQITFLALQDREILLTPSRFPLQDKSKHVCGDLERSISIFDPRSRLHDDPNRSWCTSVDASWEDKHIGTIFTSLFLCQKLLTKNGLWPLMTSYDLSSVKWSKIVSRWAGLASDTIILNVFDSSDAYLWKKKHTNFHPSACNGKVRKLAWP